MSQQNIALVGVLATSLVGVTCTMSAATVDDESLLITSAGEVAGARAVVDDWGVLVDPDRPVLTEWVYEPAAESGAPVDTDDDPSCVLRIYGMATVPMSSGGTRLSVAAQTRCAHKVDALEHHAQLVQEWSPWIEDGYPGVESETPALGSSADTLNAGSAPGKALTGNTGVEVEFPTDDRISPADKAPWEGWVEHVGPVGAADTPEAAGYWVAHDTFERYLHQANVRVMCDHTSHNVAWEAAIFGKVTYKGRDWVATPTGHSLESCWV